MTALRLELAEYDLADEIRKLTYDHARKLARAAARAVGEPVQQEQLDRMSDGDWATYLRELDADRAFMAGLSRAYSLSEIAETDEFDNGVRSFLVDVDTELAAEMVDHAAGEGEIGDVLEATTDATKEAIRRLLGPAAPAPAPEAKLWFVFQKLPRAPRARKRRVFRFVAVAPSAEAAVELVRADRPRTLHECEWTAEEVEGYAAIDWELEK